MKGYYVALRGQYIYFLSVNEGNKYFYLPLAKPWNCVLISDCIPLYTVSASEEKHIYIYILFNPREQGKTYQYIKITIYTVK